MCALQWRHNGRDGVPNHQAHDCLLNRLFRRRSKKTSNLLVDSLVTGEFRAQMASNAEKVSICRRHHGLLLHPCNIHYLYIDSPYWWMPDVSLIYNSVFSRRRVCWCWLIAPSVIETWYFLSIYRVNYSSIFVLLNNTDFVNDTTPGMLLFSILLMVLTWYVVGKEDRIRCGLWSTKSTYVHPKKSCKPTHRFSDNYKSIIKTHLP